MREENIFKNLNVHFSYLHDWFFRKKIIGGNSFSQAAPFNRCQNRYDGEGILILSHSVDLGLWQFQLWRFYFQLIKPCLRCRFLCSPQHMEMFQMRTGLWWLLLQGSLGSRCMDSVVVLHRLSCSAACGIFMDRSGTCVPCIGKQILNHQTTREVLFPTFASCASCLFCREHSYHLYLGMLVHSLRISSVTIQSVKLFLRLQIGFSALLL